MSDSDIDSDLRALDAFPTSPAARAHRAAVQRGQSKKASADPLFGSISDLGDAGDSQLNSGVFGAPPAMDPDLEGIPSGFFRAVDDGEIPPRPDESSLSSLSSLALDESAFLGNGASQLPRRVNPAPPVDDIITFEIDSSSQSGFNGAAADSALDFDLPSVLGVRPSAQSIISAQTEPPIPAVEAVVASPSSAQAGPPQVTAEDAEPADGHLTIPPWSQGIRRPKADTGFARAVAPRPEAPRPEAPRPEAPREAQTPREQAGTAVAGSPAAMVERAESAAAVQAPRQAPRNSGEPRSGTRVATPAATRGERHTRPSGSHVVIAGPSRSASSDGTLMFPPLPPAPVADGVPAMLAARATEPVATIRNASMAPPPVPNIDTADPAETLAPDLLVDESSDMGSEAAGPPPMTAAEANAETIPPMRAERVPESSTSSKQDGRRFKRVVPRSAG